MTQDPLGFYFFILDWAKNRKDTEVLLALNENAIIGLALIYDSRIIQLRGPPDAVEELIGQI